MVNRQQITCKEKKMILIKIKINVVKIYLQWKPSQLTTRDWNSFCVRNNDGKYTPIVVSLAK